jgi:hypothetical protein
VYLPCQQALHVVVVLLIVVRQHIECDTFRISPVISEHCFYVGGVEQMNYCKPGHDRLFGYSSVRPIDLGNYVINFLSMKLA